MGRELGLGTLGGPLIWGKDGEQAMLFFVILNCVYGRKFLLVIDPGISDIWVWFLSRLSHSIFSSLFFFLCPFLIYLVLTCLLYCDTETGYCLFPSLSTSPAYPLGLAICQIGSGEAASLSLVKRHLVPYHTGSHHQLLGRPVFLGLYTTGCSWWLKGRGKWAGLCKC